MKKLWILLGVLLLIPSRALAQIGYGIRTDINYFYRPDTVSKLTTVTYKEQEGLCFEVNYLAEYNIYTKSQTLIKKYSSKYKRQTGYISVESNEISSENVYNSFNRYYLSLGLKLEDSHRTYYFNCVQKDKISLIDYKITDRDLKLGQRYIDPEVYKVKKYDKNLKDYCDFYIVNIPSEIVRNITQVIISSVGTVTNLEVVQNNLGMQNFVDTSVYYTMLFRNADDSKMSNILINPEVYKEYVYVERARKKLTKIAVGR